MTSTPDQLAQSSQRSLQDCIQEGIKAEIAPLFDELRRFTDRRIAELSSEIHATVQLFDFGEANLSGQLAKIQEQVAVMVAMPVAATRNSGLDAHSGDLERSFRSIMNTDSGDHEHPHKPA